MKLLYFSSGPRERVLIALIEAGHEIDGVYVTDPARWPKVRPTIEIAGARGIPMRVLRRADLAALSEEVSGRTCLSAGFGLLFPKRVIDAAALILNVHGSLLPHYAGARTLNWVIAAGERQSGVTVHKVDEGVDTGPILCQRSFALSPFETGASLARKTLELEPAVVLEALALLESGRTAFLPQDRAAAERYPDRLPEHSELDPSRPLSELYDAIRAADPERYPAYFFVGNEKVCIRLWRPSKPVDESDLV